MTITLWRSENRWNDEPKLDASPISSSGRFTRLSFRNAALVPPSAVSPKVARLFVASIVGCHGQDPSMGQAQRGHVLPAGWLASEARHARAFGLGMTPSGSFHPGQSSAVILGVGTQARGQAGPYRVHRPTAHSGYQRRFGGRVRRTGGARRRREA